MPSMSETTNINIALRRKGWSDTEINDFMVFIETNRPTQEQAEEAKAYQVQKAGED
ncbi:MAG: hypothetical protein IJV04_10440 [Lachnospiraceae bacterium]|nr:hypothetical protein [Lachnospiraceae bacterium]